MKKNFFPSRNFELAVELTTAEKKGAHPTKIFLDTYAKNVDLKRYQFDSKFDLGYECHAGRHVYAQTVRSGPQDGKLVVDFQVRFHQYSHHLYISSINSNSVKLISNLLLQYFL